MKSWHQSAVHIPFQSHNRTSDFCWCFFNLIFYFLLYENQQTFYCSHDFCSCRAFLLQCLPVKQLARSENYPTHFSITSLGEKRKEMGGSFGNCWWTASFHFTLSGYKHMHSHQASHGHIIHAYILPKFIYLLCIICYSCKGISLSDKTATSIEFVGIYLIYLTSVGILSVMHLPM